MSSNKNITKSQSGANYNILNEMDSNPSDKAANKKRAVSSSTAQVGPSSSKKIEKTYQAGRNHKSGASASGFVPLNYNIDLGYEIAVILKANNSDNQDIEKTLHTLNAVKTVPKTLVKPFDKLQFARAMMEFMNEKTTVPDSDKPALIQKLRNTEKLILKERKETENTYNTFVFPLPNYLSCGFTGLSKFISDIGKKSTMLSMEERWIIISTWDKFTDEQKKHLCSIPLEEQTKSTLISYFKIPESFISGLNRVASIAPPSEEDFYASLSGGSSSAAPVEVKKPVEKKPSNPNSWAGKAEQAKEKKQEIVQVKPEPKKEIVSKKQESFEEEEFDWDADNDDSIIHGVDYPLM
jgi:hypothetical protein